LKCVPTDEWMKKNLVSVHTMEYYSAFKKITHVICDMDEPRSHYNKWNKCRNNYHMTSQILGKGWHWPMGTNLQLVRRINSGVVLHSNDYSQ
jgi:hypothetical protein